MGMGHAVYKTTDPRAEVLYRLSKTVNKERQTPWFDMTDQVEKTTKKYFLQTRKQSIYPNVDLYSASLYYGLGIPMDLFTPNDRAWSSYFSMDRELIIIIGTVLETAVRICSTN